MSQTEYWRLKINGELEIMINRDPHSYKPFKLSLAKPLSLDSEDLGWFTAAVAFALRVRRQNRGYRYKWNTTVPVTWWLPVETRRQLGRIERAYRSGRDLDLSLES